MIGKDQINPQADFKEPFFDCTPEGDLVLRINKDCIYKLERYDGEDWKNEDYAAIENLVKKVRDETDQSE